MKVETVLTIRLTGEGETVGDFALAYRNFRNDIEQCVADQKAIEVPHTTVIRWLLNGKEDA